MLLRNSFSPFWRHSTYGAIVLQRGLLVFLAKERPKDVTKIISRRLLPLGPDGGINPKLHDLTSRLKLRKQQYEELKEAWERYKRNTIRARSQARLAVHQALANNQMTGAEVSGLCSMIAAAVRYYAGLLHYLLAMNAAFLLTFLLFCFCLCLC